mmetsp:Transcript_119761/g.334278  ORF Transcript_119761/g.334278 Transcript_119761/m.334278 type:complete len:118 (-) Transcript_119761:126-479(-)
MPVTRIWAVLVPAICFCGELGLLKASAQDVGEIPLDLRFPGLVHCDPKETHGCLERCNARIAAQKTPALRLCALVRCLSGCTKPTSRGCPTAGERACELLQHTLETQNHPCAVDCAI